ncbi:hypothetical protein ACH35V_14305 [Actinomadura sp. 1N219]|uniref:hypothetical protein n=1 Tax=Actinomadura sp. 1N219 TaxID=3375152 RepID=UPI00378E27A5
MSQLTHEPEPPVAALAAARVYADDLLGLPNVFGVGVARKIVGGRRTDTTGVVVYVTRKEPPANLQMFHRVPRELTVSDERVPTDVVQTAPPELRDVTDGKLRPVVGGCMLGTSWGSTGTCGGVFYDRHWPMDPVLLTNNHVLTRPETPNQLPSMPTVWQPAGVEAIGSTRRVEPWWPAPLGAGHAYEFSVDAGIVGLLPEVRARPEILSIAGKHPFVVLPPSLDMQVVRRGFRTQLKPGTVEAIGSTVLMTNRAGKRVKCGVGGTLFAIRSEPGEVTAMAGDSGSLVLDAAGFATRGLVFGSEPDYGGITWACDILDVMRAMEIDTACNGGIRRLVGDAVLKALASLMAEREKLIGVHLRKFAEFRADYLSGSGEGALSRAFGALLDEESGQAIAWALLTDEEFAGLLNRAIGDWLVQPSIFEMLEYVLPEEFAPDLLAAFARLNRIEPDAIDTGWLEDVLQDAAGRSMREVLDRQVKAPQSGRFRT